MKKVKLTSFFAALLVLSSLLCTTSCSSRHGPPPKLESVYDRLVEVIEASHDVNVLLFGEGLPVYARDDAEDELIHRYYGVADNGREYVTPYAKYATIDDMKAAVSEVYGSDYRESLFASTFTGFADSGISGNLPARYSEDEHSLYQNKYVEPLVRGVRTYDYASMKIMDGSYDTFIRVSVRSYSEDQPGVWTTDHLSFVYENGNWYLDSPSC